MPLHATTAIVSDFLEGCCAVLSFQTSTIGKIGTFVYKRRMLGAKSFGGPLRVCFTIFDDLCAFANFMNLLYTWQHFA